MTSTKRRRHGYAIYLCTMGCVEDCRCKVTACDVEWRPDGERDTSWDASPINHERTIVEGHPCLVFRYDEEHPHPPEHCAIDEAGRLHEWADGDSECRITVACPECGEYSCAGAAVLCRGCGQPTDD